MWSLLPFLRILIISLVSSASEVDLNKEAFVGLLDLGASRLVVRCSDPMNAPFSDESSGDAEEASTPDLPLTASLNMWRENLKDLVLLSL